MFSYKTTTGSGPLYLNSLLQIYVPSRSLRSASEQCIVVPFQRNTKSHSQTVTLTVPTWWNDLPNSIRAAESIFKKGQKNASLPSSFDNLTLITVYKNNNNNNNNWPSRTCTLYSISILTTCFLFIYYKNDPLTLPFSIVLFSNLLTCFIFIKKYPLTLAFPILFSIISNIIFIYYTYKKTCVLH